MAEPLPELVPLAEEPLVEADPLTEEETPEPAAEDAAPAGPAFGLVFQAPEVTVAPRRRRATAPAQAPAEKPVDSTPVEQPAESAPAAEATPEAAPTERSAPSEGPDAADDGEGGSRGRRRRGGRGRRARGKGEDEQAPAADQDGDTPAAEDEAPARGGRGGRQAAADDTDAEGEGDSSSSRRRRRRRRGGAGGEGDDPPGTVTRVREPRAERDEPTAVKGSTRLEAKKQRRREGREAGRRRTIITEAEFLARRESVERTMVVRGREGRTQIGVLEDGVLVEHYVSRETTASMAGNVYLGRVQNVLPSMEAAFVDIGKGRNAVLYAGEVNWDAAGLEVNQAKRIENALKSGDTVLVQVTKDPIGHKGARLTSQISLPGRYVVYVPEGSMTGISRKLPDTERARLKAILKEVVPDGAGVIVRTAAEGASEADLKADVERLMKQWERIEKKAASAKAKKSGSGGAPALLHGEPDLTIRVIRDVFTEDFASLVVSGEKAWGEVSEYVEDVAPDLAQRVSRWTSDDDVFAAHRIDEQIAKAMDRKVWLPSGGSLVIDRTEAMTVVDVNTGKFVGSGGNLEETVTKNNLEAAEEIVRQLRLRDIGGIIVIDFIDMVLESNRDLVVRRLLECLGRDRTKHQVAEVTSLGLVQMTRKRVGSGLIEVFSEQCEHCSGRGIVVHTEPIDRSGGQQGGGHGSSGDSGRSSGRSGRRGGSGATGGGAPSGGGSTPPPAKEAPAPEPARPLGGPTAAQIAAAAHAAALKHTDPADVAAEIAAAVTAPVTEEPAVEPAPVVEPAPEPVVEPAPVQAPAPVVEATQPAAEAAPAPRARRKRGRVVAPAGPPPGAADAPADGDA
ncbi:Rne/Rng family ribonuclease [Arthrobacter sp. NEB 688]|nr:Rne/Rng family ribonuclease [Arthrobacter sp. NEB 688]